MDKKVKILVVAGSLRKGSYNKKLARIASAEAEKAGAAVTEVDLLNYSIPLYNGDDEEVSGLPADVKKLKDLMKGSDGYIFASPEYNSSISGVLKNVIDWASRPEESDPGSLVAYRGKTAAIMSASPGALGGLRGLVHLRAILGNIGVFVLPTQLCISKAADAFTEQGALKDSLKENKLSELVEGFINFTQKLS